MTRPALLAAAFLLLSAGAFARERIEIAGSSCSVCHLASTSDVAREGAEARTGPSHDAVHAARGVGCEKCHGGNPLSTDPAQAHRDVLAPANFRSPVNPANLARTCGACHRANAAAFDGTVHQMLVIGGDRSAPTCLTCHSASGAGTMTPAALEARCATCHPRGSTRGDYPALMRQALETLHALRARADALDVSVAGAGDRDGRVERLGLIFDAKALLRDAVGALHRGDAAAMVGRLDVVRQRLDATDAINAELADR